MPRKESKLRPDVNEVAFRVVQAGTGQGERREPSGHQGNPVAASRGRKGGQKGGPARKAKLSPERRSEIARKAAASRWKKQKPQ